MSTSMTTKQYFDAIGPSFDALQASKQVDRELLSQWQGKVNDVLARCYYTAFQNLMDDSGLSDQPFFVEGDSFLLSLLADPRFDVHAQGLVLSFINLLEIQIQSLTEGGRKLNVLFIESHATGFAASPYFMALRSVAMAYLKHALCIPVYHFQNVDATVLMPFYNSKSPLFTFVNFPTFSQIQLKQLATIFTFNNSIDAKLLDLSQLQFKFGSFILFLAAHNQRVARLNEVSSLDGMLQAHLYTPYGASDESHFDLAITLPPALEQLYFPQPQSTTHIEQLCGISTPKLFTNISTQLLSEANIPSHRIASLIAIFTILYGGKSEMTSAQSQFVILTLFHALVCEMLPLINRPQPITPIKSNADIFSNQENIFPFFTALQQFSFELFESVPDAIIAPCVSSLADIYDGSLLRSLFSSSHNTRVATELLSPQFKSIIQVATNYITCLKLDAIQLTQQAITTKPEQQSDLPVLITAEPNIQLPTFFVTEDQNKIISPAAYAAIQWAELPEIDTQLLKVLLYSIGDNGSIYSIFKDNQHLDPSLAIKTKQKVVVDTKANEPEELDDWDATPQDELDEWDADGDDDDNKDEQAPEDAWDAEETTDTATVPTVAKSTKPSHAQLLGGMIILLQVVNLSKGASHWNTHQLVGDGSTMVAADKEALFVYNPIRVNRDVKNAMMTLLMKYRNLSNYNDPYPMPPEEKIKSLVTVSGPQLTLERAKTWLHVTATNLKTKLDNSRVTKANSTKKEYNQSMLTPSRVVLRDIVATEQVGDIPGVVVGNTKDNNNNNNNGTETKKSGQKPAGKKGQPQKESIQEKVARETQEKHAKADLDKVTSIISTCRHPSLAARIHELDQKLLAHSDLPSALHGLMTLLDWRVKLWQQTVETKPPSTSSNSAAASAQVDAHMDVAVRLLQLLMDLSRRFLHIISREQITKIQNAYAMLGFFDSEIEVELRWQNATGQARHTTAEIQAIVAKSAQTSKSTTERRYSVGMSRAQFLLQYAGHILLRNVKSAKDHRVDGFYPDKWQRDLLDIVDANESALVVAPTSAGKTLVSFYTVEHVLRQNKEESTRGGQDKRGLVVFVAPTFPLARQMEADISNRNKEAVVVIHDTNQKLPNHRFDVLITLPSCLENLMTSPSRVEWVPRIRYIVFDEVHSIGSTLNGPIWERLFLLAHQTPFLALSATVGGVEHFRDWLISMRAKYLQGESGLAKNVPIIANTALTHAVQPSPKVHHISTSVRWSHLHHYFYIPPTSFFETALAEVQTSEKSANLTIAAVQPPPQSDGFVPLHPVAALSLNSVSTSINPDGTTTTHEPSDAIKAEMNGIDERALKGLFNVEFSSSDALQLYNTIQLVTLQSPRFQALSTASPSPTNTQENIDKLTVIQNEVDRLNPDKYFGFFVEKIHVLEYERQLKELLLKFFYAVCDTEVMSIISTLSTDIQQILQPLSMATRARQDLWKKQFVPLLRSLQQRDWFPAIIFCLDRTLCTELLYHVVKVLEAEEHAQWVKENNKRLDKKAREREYEAALKAAKKLRDNKGKGSAEAAKELEEEIRMGLVDPSVLNPDALKNLKPYNPEDWNADPPDDRFSFVKETEWMSEDVRQYWEGRINRRRGGKSSALNGQSPLIKALYRGFGVHHYGVDKQYRDLVEILFRQRNLKFVISIETLGLGVNMPCRTTVFAFTTVALNPLNYRQMSGRAGRRGFDDKGQVIFFAIDPHHAGRLMTSSLTPLCGHYNLSCSTVLRICLKFFFCKETQNALNQISNTTITAPNGTKQTIQVTLSQNNVMLDQMVFLTRSFFTFSEQFPQQVRIQLLHHFRFSFAYFQYLQLFNNNAPSGLAYFLSAVSTTTSSTSTSAKVPSYINDSGAFTLVYLLRNGYIDKLCADYDQQPDATAAKVMALLCHLFFPLRLRSGSTASDYPQPAALQPGTLPGHVILPPIEQCVNQDIDKAIKEHDHFVLQLFARYSLAVVSTTQAIAQSATTLSTQLESYHTPTTLMSKDEFTLLQQESEHVMSLSTSLPLSCKSTTSNPQPDNQLIQSLTETSIKSSIRTPFHTLSTSKGDTFEDVFDLLHSVVKPVELRQSQLPINVDRYSPSPIQFSSYALDFYLNGNYDDVILVHGIHKAEAWETLMRFSKLLQTLKKSLAILASTADEDNDDDFDEDAGADGEDKKDSTFDILKKSNLFQNNHFVKEHLYIPPEMVSQHRTTARCFKHVFKTFQDNFTSISREKNIA